MKEPIERFRAWLNDGTIPDDKKYAQLYSCCIGSDDLGYASIEHFKKEIETHILSTGSLASGDPRLSSPTAAAAPPAAPPEILPDVDKKVYSELFEEAKSWLLWWDFFLTIKKVKEEKVMDGELRSLKYPPDGTLLPIPNTIRKNLYHLYHFPRDTTIDDKAWRATWVNMKILTIKCGEQKERLRCNIRDIHEKLIIVQNDLSQAKKLWFNDKKTITDLEKNVALLQETYDNLLSAAVRVDAYLEQLKLKERYWGNQKKQYDSLSSVDSTKNRDLEQWLCDIEQNNDDCHDVLRSFDSMCANVEGQSYENNRTYFPPVANQHVFVASTQNKHYFVDTITDDRTGRPVSFSRRLGLIGHVVAVGVHVTSNQTVRSQYTTEKGESLEVRTKSYQTQNHHGLQVTRHGAKWADLSDDEKKMSALRFAEKLLEEYHRQYTQQNNNKKTPITIKLNGQPQDREEARLVIAALDKLSAPESGNVREFTLEKNLVIGEGLGFTLEQCSLESSVFKDDDVKDYRGMMKAFRQNPDERAGMERTQEVKDDSSPSAPGPGRSR